MPSAYQARDDSSPKKEKPTQVLENCLKVVNPTGSIGIIGVYIAPDPGAKGNAKQGVEGRSYAASFSANRISIFV